MPKVTGLGHVGIYVSEPSLMVDFYAEFLGLEVTDRGENDSIIFLSSHPEIEHHEVALVKSNDRRTDAQQISFTCGTLADLREFYRRILERGYPIDMVVNHGIALGCYFRDPEGNRVEVYWRTGKSWPQPFVDPIDLSQGEEELRALIEAL